MHDQLVVAVDGESARATSQSADIILCEVATHTAAAWWITSIFVRYPGCLVAAARHDHGHWCELAAREQAPELVRPRFGERLSRQAVEDVARGRYERLVAP